MKLGLYSITYLGVWYDGPALTVKELIERAKRFGYDGIELDGKRPHGHPMDLSSAACRDIRLQVADAGLELYAVAANNDFSSPVTETRESQLGYVKDLVRVTADLGAKVLRIFAAWPGVHKQDIGASYDMAERIWADSHRGFSCGDVWDWCRDGLVEAAAWARDAGIVLALQNHHEVVNNYRDMLRMIRDVGSPNLRAAFDAPLGRKQGVTSMRTAAMEVGPLQTLSHFGGEYEQDRNGRVNGFVRHRNGSLTPEDFYPDFAMGMRDIGYEGYIGYELCHPLPDVDGKPAGLDFVDYNARLAAEYMRNVILQANTTELLATKA